jgi:16S rRNA U1498 N3-methylase RsmE
MVDACRYKSIGHFISGCVVLFVQSPEFLQLFLWYVPIAKKMVGKKWDDQAERCNKKIIAATKQSWNSPPAVLQKPLSFSEAVAAVSGPVFAADEPGMSIDSVADGFENRPLVMHCFIGPPGGFSPEEQSAFDGHQALRISFDNVYQTAILIIQAWGVCLQHFLQ